ncbi:MAG: zeta toxin family protein [Myxococcales bacterium]|nr:zeta toxin family protein [Myxococcales bacterium]
MDEPTGVRAKLARAAGELDQLLAPWIETQRGRCVVCIGGESGSGKTTIAAALTAALAARGERAVVVSMDDYYHLPPRQNDAARARDLSRVGCAEIDIQRLERVAASFLGGAGELALRRLRADREGFDELTEGCADAAVLLLEGTFVLAIDIDTGADSQPGASARVLVARDFRDTEAGRRARQRDVLDDVMQRVLAIEHEQVSAHRGRAHVVVERDFSVRLLAALPARSSP